MQQSSKRRTPPIGDICVSRNELLTVYGFRAELGRATWKYFHTVMARYPETPTDDQKEALRSYIYLFARLYPW